MEGLVTIIMHFLGSQESLGTCLSVQQHLHNNWPVQSDGTQQSCPLGLGQVIDVMVPAQKIQ